MGHDTDQVEFTAEELLADHAYAEPLVAAGVRCHGGFDEDGRYVSPRTLHRVPAIAAWEAKRVAEAGTEILHLPIDTWPEHFPSVAQSTFLIGKGVTQPTVSELTRIGTVEGFGAMMRYLPLPDLQQIFADSIRGTATDHIRKGLFEAHSRDEAGFEDEAGHDKMWFAARDIAFEHPVTEDQTAAMLSRMGIPSPAAGAPDLEKLRAAALAARVLPDDIPFELEAVLTRMIGLLFIELSAFRAFSWAEAVLSDDDLVAGEGEAGRIVSYIRQDETPHVGYLQVALSEMRDRTWRGSSGTTYDGAEMIRLLWDRALQDSLVARRADFLRLITREIEASVAGRADADDVLDEFFALGSVHRLADGTLVEVAPGGEELRVPPVAA